MAELSLQSSFLRNAYILILLYRHQIQDVEHFFIKEILLSPPTPLIFNPEETMTQPYQLIVLEFHTD